LAPTWYLRSTAVRSLVSKNPGKMIERRSSSVAMISLWAGRFGPLMWLMPPYRV